MSCDLQQRLLDIEDVSFVASKLEDAVDDVSGERAFSRFCLEVLAVYNSCFLDISAAWISASGLEPGYLKAIVSLPEVLAPQIRTIGKKEGKDLAKGCIEVLSRPFENAYFRAAVPAAKEVLIICLVRNDEQFGILVLCSEIEDYFSGAILTRIQESRKLLNRLVEQAHISQRLKIIAAPFDFAARSANKDLIYEQIVAQACRGLAGDGSELRVRNPIDTTLEVKARYGLLAGNVQLTKGNVFDRICQHFVESSEFVTAQILQSDGTCNGFGLQIRDDDAACLRQFGVQAYMIMRLQCSLHISEQPSREGTLSVFHHLPLEISLLNINLFRGFCDRVEKYIAVLEQRDENEVIRRLLEAQFDWVTRAELTSLLGHDFGHRVYHLKANVEEFIESCQRHWQNRSLPSRVKADADAVRESCNELSGIVQQIRRLGQGVHESPTTFTISSVLTEVSDRLSTVLERNNMSLVLSVNGSCQVQGVRGILLQVFFNLVINSIDAQRACAYKKRNAIHFTCREVNSGQFDSLEFKVWDEGPGINRIVFPNPQQIFDIGTSSKRAELGTGTGLPIARRLLLRYFDAYLELVDPTKALFEFKIRAKR